MYFKLFLAKKYIFYAGIFATILYVSCITIVINLFKQPVELGITIFYILLFFSFLTPIWGEIKLSLFRLLRTVIFPSSVITFPEVILADALTSLSKVLKDFGTTIVVIYSYSQGSSPIDYHTQAMLFVAFLTSLPFWLRVRQCYVQLESTTDPILKIPVILNIGKYMSAFPAIWLTAMASIGYENPNITYYISLAATVNSFYSYGVSYYYYFYT